MPTCIYCRADSDESAFTREHVMPQAFGTFEENLVLRREVCGNCNQTLGREVETAARSSG